MGNIQERIGITFEPLSDDICSHIITDRQWLQENILCLLSNAVKYSTEGNVTVSAFITSSTSSFFCKSVNGNSLSPINEDKVSQHDIGHSSSHSCHYSETVLWKTQDNASISLDNLQNRIDNNNYPLKSLESAIPSPFACSYLQFEIEDCGIGMSEEAMKKLFSPFKQAQRLAGGTGLGLYSLAKRMEAIKGFFGVRNRKNDEKGTLFWFAIPYRPDFLTAEATANEDAITLAINDIPLLAGKEDETTLSIMNKDGSILLNTAKKRRLSILGSLKTRFTNSEILIVDDSPPILKMSSMMLKRHGFIISTAENGEIALKKFEEKWKTTGKGYDLILMDLQMPIMDGLEATRRLRQLEDATPDWLIETKNRTANNLNHQLIFGVSANSDHETMKEAVDAGIDDFLAKPFSIDCLISSLCKYVLHFKLNSVDEGDPAFHQCMV
jgi:CheY-like chemotaxis protein